MDACLPPRAEASTWLVSLGPVLGTYPALTSRCFARQPPLHARSAGAAAVQNSGLSSFTSFGQGQVLEPDLRSGLALMDAERAISANIGNGFAATSGAAAA